MVTGPERQRAESVTMGKCRTECPDFIQPKLEHCTDSKLKSALFPRFDRVFKGERACVLSSGRCFLLLSLSAAIGGYIVRPCEARVVMSGGTKVNRLIDM